MKPSFALNLSHDGLSLLRRATGGWRAIGQVALDTPSLADDLALLRKTAAELAEGQLAAKLVIPNSQILYKTMELGNGVLKDRRAEIAQALDGQTPYPVEELAFDWVENGSGTVQVAAVARETLDEAESFATEHRFNPVSFVAIPEPENFDGEPFFGPSGLSETLLHPGEEVERDTIPIEVVGPLEPEGERVLPDWEIASARLAENDALTDPAPADPGETPPAKAAQEVTGDDNATEALPVPNFSSRRSDSGDPEFTPSLKGIEARFVLYGDKARPDDGVADQEQDARPGDADVQTPEPEQARVPEPEITRMAVTAPTLAGDKPKGKGRKSGQRATKSRAGISGGDKSVRKPAVSPPEPEAPAAASDDAARLTVFGAREKPASTPQASPPKWRFWAGLLAGITLVLLVTSLLFGKPFSTSWLFGASQEPKVEAKTVAVAEPVVETVIPEEAARVGAPETPPSTPAAPAPIATPAPEQIAALPETDNQPRPAIAAPTEAELAETGAVIEDLTLESTAEIYARSGIWPLDPVPPVDLDTDRIEDVYIASIDRRIIGPDAIALPGVGALKDDFALGRMLPPPPPGTQFDLDARGFVQATRDGAPTPSGAIVFAGKPRVVPSLRPGSAAPVAVAENQPDREALARVRPRARPTNLIEQDERSRLGGRSRTELARIRPLARPASPQTATPGQDETPTELAIVRSRQPVARPNGFAAAVANALAEAVANPPQDAPAATVAAVAPARAPSIPTKASVAREATMENAISLSKVNLIGIYGSSSDRRALVRLKNGRYVKVKVGDRLDGGQVAAIGTKKLQYIKRGRTVTLEIAS